MDIEKLKNLAKKRVILIAVFICLVLLTALVWSEPQENTEPEVMYNRYLKFRDYVKGGVVQAHWMSDYSMFWYEEGSPDQTVIYMVDPKKNNKVPFFDTMRVRKGLTSILRRDLPGSGLPFQEFFFEEGEKAVRFIVRGQEFLLHLDNYRIDVLPSKSEKEKSRFSPRPGEAASPGNRWFVSVKNNNLWLRSGEDGTETALTTDGADRFGWRAVEEVYLPSLSRFHSETWSPDGLRIIAEKIDWRQVHHLPVVHWLKPEEDVDWSPYPRTGRNVPQVHLYFIDIMTKKQVKIDIGEYPDRAIHIIGWRKDGSEALFIRVDRAHKNLDLMAADPETGASRVILTEHQETFVEGLRLNYVWPFLFTPVGDGTSFLWLSEQDGWSHVYHYAISGRLIRRLSNGQFPVEQVVAVDEKGKWVYFLGRGDRERPYDLHLYRVDFGGQRFTRLTVAPGEHVIQFAPSLEFFLDTHSSVSQAPITELRRVDGTLKMELAAADTEALEKLKWTPPEEFVVKAADGITDLHGVIFKPWNFDPDNVYPVIDYLYGGPHATIVPHAFLSATDSYYAAAYYGVHAQAIAQLGFIVFMVDARGTPGRGKAFQDIVYKAIGRNEIPDHVAVLKQLASQRPYIDLSRVGVTGYSYGGYFTIRALLMEPAVYHVGVARGPIVDLSALQLAIEPYMGLPQENKEAYEFASNVRIAENLKGKLLVVIGTTDVNAPFSHTMRLIDKFVSLGMPHDLVVLPEQPHSLSGASLTYYQEALRRYFQAHLGGPKKRALTGN